MNIKTKLFGEINIKEEDTILFKDGLPGFEEYKEYILLKIEDSNLNCIQSIEENNVCLILASPWDYFKEYEIYLSEIETNQLEIKGKKDTVVYNVLNIAKDKVTINLLAPVVINTNKKLGKQVVLSDSKYSIRQEILCL